MRQEILRMERVTYKEKEIVFLEDFNLQIYQGEIMGMLMINGHGLSAFLQLLQTNLPLYDGYVYYGGEIINSWKAARKFQNRISIIGAENRLVENLSVSDNIFVLRQGFRQEFIRTKLLSRQLTPFLEDIGMNISVDARVENLTVFERVVVELLRAVVMGHHLIVLNEVGTLISHDELKKLHEILRHYAKKGFSFLYIGVHLEEVTMICDRCAMLSNGRITKVIRKEEMENETIYLYPAEYDRMVRYHQKKRNADEIQEEELLQVNRINGAYLKNLTFRVYEGECLAVQILNNSAFQELTDIILGNLRPQQGEIIMGGEHVRFPVDRRIAVIKELATKTMIFPELDYMENLCISLLQRVPSLWRKKGIRNSIRKEYGPFLGEEVFELSVEKLSEKQKYQMIYTRILLQKPKVVFCIHPFKGADLPMRMFVWQMMEMLLNHGIAVVILSLNLSDSLSLADRLVVIGKEGQLEMHREDFAHVPGNVPWTHIYKNDKM